MELITICALLVDKHTIIVHLKIYDLIVFIHLDVLV